MTAHNTIKFASETWSKGFTMVPNHVLEADELSSGAKLTFALLMKHGRDKAQAYPGQVRMSRAVQCTEKTLRGYIRELESVGLVEIARRGQGLTNLYILHPDKPLRQVETTVPDKPSATDQDGLFSTGEEDRGKEDEGKETGTPAAGEDEAQKLYEAYIEIVRRGEHGRLPEAIPSGYRKDANAALADWPMDSLLLALRGFVNYRAKKAGGDRFSDIFGTHIRQSRTERIEFWISNAEGGGASALTGVPSGERVKITRAVVDAQRAFGSRDPDTLATGEQALKFLKERGIEPETRGDRLYFPALGGKA